MKYIYKADNVRADNIEAALNEQADQNWEFVSMAKVIDTEVHSRRLYPAMFLLVFRRPLEEKPQYIIESGTKL